MKIQRCWIDISLLPVASREILELLQGQKELAIKGGLARLALLEKLKKEGKDIKNFRLLRERDLKDVDIIIFHYRRLAEEKSMLIARQKQLREMLNPILQQYNIRFDGRDAEPFRGSLNGYKQETLEKILSSRDLTINEIVLVFEGNQWFAYYRPRCYRDLIFGISMLTNNGGWKTTRYDFGRVVPTNYGLYRLLRPWVEGKAEKIFLPQWQVKAHFREIFKLQQQGKLPEGGNLGRYSLILAGQYKNANEQVKERWMRALFNLGLTDTLLSFDDYAFEQKLLDNLKNEFDFEEDMPFQEIIDKIIQFRRQKQEGRHQRNQNRNTCVQHQYEMISCDGCKENCNIKKCINCNFLDGKTKESFTCNQIFSAGNWRENESALRAFPIRASPKEQIETVSLASVATIITAKK